MGPLTIVAFPAFFAVAAFIGLVIVGIIWSIHLAAKKRAEMAKVAASLGLAFSEEENRTFDERFHFIDKLCQGDNRYGFNVMSGVYRGHRVLLFDYHYETTSTDSKGKRETSHHYFSFFVLQFDADFPELLICREGWFSKITQFMGFDDIDFESAEFSNAFLVKSPDKKFAYDICHGQMIELLLDNRDLDIEIEHNCLTLFFGQHLEPAKISFHLDQLVAIRKLFPDYLMEKY